MREFEAIEQFRRILGDPPQRVITGIGDDAAVTEAGAFAVTSVDAVVDGVHFTRGDWSARAIGWKAAASAISDLAAMAADPADLLVAAGLPGDLDDHELAELFGGIKDAADSCGMAVVGGDTVGSPVLWLSVTVVGYVSSSAPAIGRGDGRPSDILAVTGALGGAKAGLALMQDPSLVERARLTREESSALTLRQQHPEPRTAAAHALRSVGVSAMIDLSDGLAGDLAHLAAASNCGAEVELALLPTDAATAKVAAELSQDPFEFAAIGGEDYELLVALPESNAQAAKAAVIATGTTLTVIGRLVPSGPPRYTRPDGTDAELKSFQHLT